MAIGFILRHMVVGLWLIVRGPIRVLGKMFRRTAKPAQPAPRAERKPARPKVDDTKDIPIHRPTHVPPKHDEETKPDINLSVEAAKPPVVVDRRRRRPRNNGSRTTSCRP